MLANEIYTMMLPYKEIAHSITSDNGTEFYEHKQIAKKLNAEYYFANPYSSWERGVNEYTNKLVRQYISKKQTFEKIDNDKIKKIQQKINSERSDYTNKKSCEFRAKDGTRTRDPNLGKVMLYQLSYFRNKCAENYFLNFRVQR